MERISKRGHIKTECCLTILFTEIIDLTGECLKPTPLPSGFPHFSWILRLAALNAFAAGAEGGHDANLQLFLPHA